MPSNSKSTPTLVPQVHGLFSLLRFTNLLDDDLAKTFPLDGFTSGLIRTTISQDDIYHLLKNTTDNKNVTVCSEGLGVEKGPLCRFTMAKLARQKFASLADRSENISNTLARLYYRYGAEYPLLANGIVNFIHPVEKKDLNDDAVKEILKAQNALETPAPISHSELYPANNKREAFAANIVSKHARHSDVYLIYGSAHSASTHFKAYSIAPCKPDDESSEQDKRLQVLRAIMNAKEFNQSSAPTASSIAKKLSDSPEFNSLFNEIYAACGYRDNGGNDNSTLYFFTSSKLVSIYKHRAVRWGAKPRLHPDWEIPSTKIAAVMMHRLHPTSAHDINTLNDTVLKYELQATSYMQLLRTILSFFFYFICPIHKDNVTIRLALSALEPVWDTGILPTADEFSKTLKNTTFSRPSLFGNAKAYTYQCKPAKVEEILNAVMNDPTVQRVISPEEQQAFRQQVTTETSAKVQPILSQPRPISSDNFVDTHILTSNQDPPQKTGLPDDTHHTTDTPSLA
jgi:hypothetical protein